MKYVTPTFMVLLLAWYAYDGLLSHILMKGVAVESHPYRWVARLIIAVMTSFLIWGVWYAWRTHPKFFEETERAREETLS